MKLTQLLLTLGLVVGGILVYDVLLAPSPEEPVFDEVRVEAPAPPRPDAELPSLAVLEGRGDDIWRSDVERRLAMLEELPASAGRTEAVEGDPMATPTPADADAGVEGESFGEALRRERRRGTTPQEIAAFRAMLEKVERQRREEQTRRKMHEGLAKIGVELNDVQADEVVDLTLKFYRGVQSKLQSIPKNEENRAERMAVFNGMKEDYADELYGIVPRAEADRIIDAINRQANRQPKDSQR